MLESGEYKEERFCDVLDDLDAPAWKVAVLDEVEVERAITTCDQLEYIEYIRNGHEPPMVKKDFLECLRRIMEFRYQFYCRSKKKDGDIAHEYYFCTRVEALQQHFDTYDASLETLPFEFDPFLPIEYNLDRLKEFKKNAELVINHYHAKREKSESLIPASLLELGLAKVAGKSADKFFKEWARCLKVWDLVEQKEESLRSPAFYLRIGKYITEHFGVWGTYRDQDIRAQVKKDYREACDLIRSTEAGTFPIPPRPEIDPETMAGL